MPKYSYLKAIELTAAHFFFFRSQWLCGKLASGLERILCGVLVKRTTGKRTKGAQATEIMLKTALNTIQSIN